jgi:hypothetical protein
VSVWNKAIKVDFKDFFKSLSKATGAGTLGNPVLAVASALAAVKLEGDVPGLAWLLIRRALTKATFDLVVEVGDSLKTDLGEVDGSVDQLDLSLEESELKIDSSFFNHPTEIEAVQRFKAPLRQWLELHGLHPAPAQAVAERLPTYFVYALNREWRERSTDYEPIRKALDTPFAKAGARVEAWQLYFAELEKSLDEKVFDENFGLRQVYVPLRAYFEQQEDKKGREGEEQKRVGVGGRPPRRVVVDLKAELDSWLDAAQKDDNVRVVSGGPGGGKSSFARVYATHRAGRGGFQVLLVPLHRLNLKSDVREALRDYAAAKLQITEDLFDAQSGEKKLLIILDGLDELAMQGRAGLEASREFVRQVEKLIEQRDTAGAQLKVLISGREVVVQANSTDFRRPRQILHLLPYFVAKHEHENYRDEQKLLAEDQRQIWWKTYGAITAKNYDGMPEGLRRPDLEEVTSQSLLNYLVAFSYERKKIDFTQQVNLNVVYDDLVRAVHERAYEGRVHESVRSLSFGDFVRVLEEIGLAAWHGDGRTTTVREIHEHCKNASLEKLLEVFGQGAESGVTSLLTAFYFRQGQEQREGEQTFEFTHKTFGEYLTALRLRRALDRMQLQRQRKHDNPDDGWDDRECLKHWAELCGPSATDFSLLGFLRGEVHRVGAEEGGRAKVEQWQEMLRVLLNWTLQHGTPLDEFSPRLSFRDEVRHSHNADEALLAALNACARVTFKISEVSWPHNRSAAEFIVRLQQVSVDGASRLVL